MTRYFFILMSLCTVTILTLAGCAFHDLDNRQETAKRLAMPSFMLPRTVNTDDFTMKVYERVYNEGGVANIYIEGDGLVWLGQDAPQFNPTPQNPLGLHLATRDNGKNVIYIARPCQQVDVNQIPACNELVWTTDRYSENVVKNMNQALDNIKRRYNLSAFNLIGYEGGGAIVTLMTAKRDDILSIRTVGGILDHDAWTHMRDKDPLINSTNPIYVAAEISHIPQHHFVGDIDYNVTPDIYWRYYQSSGHSPCLKATVVKNASHDAGWVDRWPSLLKEPVNCQPTIPTYSGYMP